MSSPDTVPVRISKYAPSVVRLEISNLVPFDGVPWKQFGGFRLEEMIEDITPLGVRQPITVRPMSDGKYEILDGHYRVAAAMSLKFKTVPAVVLEGLSDEEALSYVSDTNSVGLWHKYDIDIYDPNYRESAAYKSMEYVKVFSRRYLLSDRHLGMALDEYIERYLLTEEEVQRTYPSIYRMGNPHELSDEECSDFSVAFAIVKEAEQTDKMSIEDKAVVEDLAKADAKELVKIFTCQGGYTEQLKKHLGIDFDSFCYHSDCYEGFQNKRERAKILYLVHKVKKEAFKNINVLLMLEKPSMENNRLASLGIRGTNWEYIYFLRHEVEKELPIDEKDFIGSAVVRLMTMWDGYMQEWIAEVENYYDTHPASPVKFAPFDRIKAALEEPYPDEDNSDIPAYGSASPLETMFLKLMQHGYLCAQSDLLYALDATSHLDYSVPAGYVEQMEKFDEAKIRVNESNDVNKSDDDSPKCSHGYVIECEGMVKKVCGSEELDKFFLPENVQKIAKYVYLKEDISKDERRAIRKSKKKLYRFLGFLQFIDTDGDILKDVTELLIISCLQLICWDNGKEILDYSFQGFEGTKRNRKGKIYVQAALRNDERVYEVVKMYWMPKVAERMYANLGKAALPKKVRELQNLYLKLLEKVLKAPDIETMLSISSFYERKLQGKIIRVTFQE